MHMRMKQRSKKSKVTSSGQQVKGIPPNRYGAMSMSTMER